jgi:hypothetical protein
MHFKRICKNWLECSLPDFGQLTVWILIVIALCLTSLEPPHQAGPRAEVAATLFSFLPETLLRSVVFYQLLRVVLAIVALSWALQRGLPWTPWATSICFMLLWALRMENVTNGAHIFHVANMLIFLHAAWYFLYRHEIAAARAEGVFWKTRLYPRWVFLLSVFYLGVFHTWAGITKISASGLDWGNGLSLQLWIYLWGWPGSPFGQLVLASRWVARLLQTGALVIESFSFLCWFGYWPRILVGLGLLGFYSGVLGTFVDYGFHFNAILVALFLLPVENWVSARAERRLNPAGRNNSESELPVSQAAV